MDLTTTIGKIVSEAKQRAQAQSRSIVVSHNNFVLLDLRANAPNSLLVQLSPDDGGAPSEFASNVFPLRPRRR